MVKRKDFDPSIPYWKSKANLYIVPASDNISNQYKQILEKSHFLKNCTAVGILLELHQPQVFQNKTSDYYISEAQTSLQAFKCKINNNNFEYDGTNIIHLKTIICQDCFLLGTLTPLKGCKIHFKGNICNHRTKLQQNCDYCCLKNFESVWTEYVDCWSDKNDKKPWQLLKKSHAKYVFQCSVCNHEFSSRLGDVARKQWCGYCTNQKLCSQKDCISCKEKSFASNPNSQYWSSKNILTPREVFKRSEKKCIFNCNICNHELEIRLAEVLIKICCSYCAHQKLCDKKDCLNCYENSFASDTKSHYWSSKNGCDPRQVFKHTTQKFIFDCVICKHEFKAQISSVFKGSWCPYCANKKLCDKEDCLSCYDNSFASNPKSQYWSVKNNCDPRRFFKHTNQKFIFDCISCKHEFDAQLITISKGQWCPYCANKKLCQEDSCLICYKNSFASDEKSKFWSVKNVINPRKVFKYSHNKYIVDCPTCKHEFKSRLIDVLNGKFCRFCCGHVCGKEDCKICDKVCEICKVRKGQRFTRITKLYCCIECWRDCILRNPEETILRYRRKITLEILCLAELQRISLDLNLLIWSETTSWDCSILPNLSFKPDLMWCFDKDGNMFSNAGTCKINTNEISYSIILEIIEESRKSHSAARFPADDIREKEIRDVLNNQVGFVYFTVAHKNHLQANKKDVYFDRNEVEYFIMEDCKDVWQTNITKVIETLQDLMNRRSIETIYIGN